MSTFRVLGFGAGAHVKLAHARQAVENALWRSLWESLSGFLELSWKLSGKLSGMLSGELSGLSGGLFRNLSGRVLANSLGICARCSLWTFLFSIPRQNKQCENNVNHYVILRIPPNVTPQLSVILKISCILIAFRIRQDLSFWATLCDVELDSKQAMRKWW